MLKPFAQRLAQNKPYLNSDCKTSPSCHYLGIGFPSVRSELCRSASKLSFPSKIHASGRLAEVRDKAGTGVTCNCAHLSR